MWNPEGLGGAPQHEMGGLGDGSPPGAGENQCIYIDLCIYIYPLRGQRPGTAPCELTGNFQFYGHVKTAGPIMLFSRAGGGRPLDPGIAADRASCAFVFLDFWGVQDSAELKEPRQLVRIRLEIVDLGPDQPPKSDETKPEMPGQTGANLFRSISDRFPGVSNRIQNFKTAR